MAVATKNKPTKLIPSDGPEQTVAVTPLQEGVLKFKLTGTAPYVQARFSQKAMRAIEDKHRAGSTSKKGKSKEPRDFDLEYEQAMHKMADGTCGIPAGAFRSALISACRLVGFRMTLAKLSLFVEADGLDVVDGVPLVRISGTPEPVTHAVRNATGVCDLRRRPMWRQWSAEVNVRFDMSQFTAADVYNLLLRVGHQVGVGEGRPDSKESTGMGWGTFNVEVVNEDRP